MYYKPSKLKPSKRSKMRKLSKIALFAGIGAVAVFFVLAFIGIIPIFKFGGANIRQLDYAIPQTAIANSNGIIYLEENKLHLKNLDGSSVWDLEIAEQAAKLTASESLAATYDTASATVINYAKEPLYTTKIDTSIENLKCGKQAMALYTKVVDEENKESGFIYIYDKDGKQAGRLPFSSREVIDFGFYGESDMLWVLTLDISAVVPTSYISTYKPDGTATGSIVLNSELVEKTFVTDSSIFVSGLNKLTKFSYFGAKEAEAVVLGMMPYASSKTSSSLKIAYVPRIKAVHVDSVKIFNNNLESITLLMPPNVVSVGVTQSKLYAISSSQLYTYNESGKLENTANIAEGIVSAKQLSNDVMLLWDKNDTYILRLT